MATKLNLDRLNEVKLRDCWDDEAGDFTPWLSNPENLALLGETVGMDLELFGTEQRVGSFSADILCKNTVTDEWVLIENQLESTDHGHLESNHNYLACAPIS